MDNHAKPSTLRDELGLLEAETFEIIDNPGHDDHQMLAATTSTSTTSSCTSSSSTSCCN